jgi:lipoprotein-anchoring transpeptidase ErfK/SrfK
MSPAFRHAFAASLVAFAVAASPARADEPPADEPAGEQAAPDQGEGRPAEVVRPPSRRRGARTARIVSPTFARTRLKSRRRGHPVRTATSWSAQPQTLLVLDHATRDGREWVKVLLADRPNGSAGWVPRNKVVLGRTRFWIEVRTRSRRVTVYRDGRRVRRFRAVVGAPGTPTPHTLAAIYERNRQPDPGAFLGPWALSLTALSNVLENYGGGPGRVAIHGRAGASLRDPLGTARSHGCIRILNRHASWIARRVPVGTPVHLRG